MPKVNLSPYLIQIREKQSDEYEDVDDLFGTGTSLQEIIESIISDFSGAGSVFKEEKGQKALKFEGNAESHPQAPIDIVQDTVYHGEYGIVRDVLDVDSGSINEDELSSSETPVFDMIFTYFEDSLLEKYGFVMVQRYSIYGYKTTFHRLLRQKIRGTLHEDAMVEMKPLISSELVEILERGGRLTDLKLIAHDVSPDSANQASSDLSESGLAVQNTNRIEFNFSAGSNLNLALPTRVDDLVDKMKEIVLNSEDTPFYELTSTEIDEIKAKVDDNGKSRTLTVGPEGERVREELPVEDNDAVNEDGTINRDLIKGHATDYARNVIDKYRDILQ